MVDLGVHQAARANRLPVRRLVCQKAEGGKERGTADAAGNGVRLMLKPTKVQGMKMQEICGLADKELKVEAMIKRLVQGYSVE
jgi:hypothetical protein